jgi:hypothetical protein
MAVASGAALALVTVLATSGQFLMASSGRFLDCAENSVVMPVKG